MDFIQLIKSLKNEKIKELDYQSATCYIDIEISKMERKIKLDKLNKLNKSETDSF